MPRFRWPIIAAALALACLLLTPLRASALEPDQILLLVNKNVAQGRQLADYYAQKRKLPDHRILELDLPETEEMPADLYDRNVVPQVRAFLRDNGLERKITCIVTFWGVPLRIANRINSPADTDELAALVEQQRKLPAAIEPAVVALEKVVASQDTSFKAGTGTDLAALGARSDAAWRAGGIAVRKIDDPARRKALDERLLTVTQPLQGPLARLE
jgi:uncharacterized protein (TIGR03790 family)